MIEIVERATCPTCGGIGIERDGMFKVPCYECGDGTVPRVLATFADAAAMIEQASWAETIYIGRVGPVVARSVLAALGVSDEQSK